jgi:hypothetical protein
MLGHIKSNVSVNSMKIFLNNTINPVPSYFYAGLELVKYYKLEFELRVVSSRLEWFRVLYWWVCPKEDGTKLDKYSGTVLLTILWNNKILCLFLRSWTTHINEIITKASSRLNIIRKLKFKVDRKSLEHMYFSYVRPILEYADVVWDNCPIG